MQEVKEYLEINKMAISEKELIVKNKSKIIKEIESMIEHQISKVMSELKSKDYNQAAYVLEQEVMCFETVRAGIESGKLKTMDQIEKAISKFYTEPIDLIIEALGEFITE